MDKETFDLFLSVMSLIALFVFIALYFIKAGYGMFRTSSWGFSINNKLAWMLMEAPVFVVMAVLWWHSDRRCSLVPLIFFLLFQLHYFQRSFIFPLLMKGKSRMPIAIMLMGVLFNLLNGFMQGEWLFYLAPETLYTADWLTTPQFVLGVLLFLPEWLSTGIPITSSAICVNRGIHVIICRRRECTVTSPLPITLAKSWNGQDGQY